MLPQSEREAVYNRVIQEPQLNFPAENEVRFHMYVCVCARMCMRVCLFMMLVHKIRQKLVLHAFSCMFFIHIQCM